MDIVTAYLPAIACAAAMVVCFLMMGRHEPQTANDSGPEVMAGPTLFEADRTATNTEEKPHG